MTDATITSTLDTTGKCCPMPMVETNRAMRALRSGEVLEIVATDPGTRTDIPSWCARTGHRLLSTSESDGTLRYYVQKA
ncbi:sulfurtransferase TusA family protein [Acidiferrobacter sp. SPIII_3]|jgi:tRNA 2-thiouridine synthesizing protein A|uniref:sulfurtransferase TusA family protein n=1 Tax=Acidiferrobacter sp. SPIII_3 TaxID=1281578 RepID=UPI000D72E4DD|nr:sulfurtransferase TusA family protein [Acidiferrobacter sp. SPIII_3]AWP24660.1 sulfurtransferase TusA family protein [Acidiferrobacter sp. SPIII_3]